MRRLGLDVLRIGSILGVVAIHVFAAIVGNSDVQGSGSWWLATVVDIGCIWVVPVFVMVSGALVLDPRMHREGPGPFYRKRLLRLGWAFVFWQVFYLVVVYMMLSRNPLTPGHAAALVFSGNTYTHLYFLWLIVGLYAVAPFVFAFIRDGGPRRALAAAIVVMAATTLTYMGASLLTQLGSPASITLMALTQWVPYAGYFLAGWALRDVRLTGWRLAVGAAATVAAVAANILLYANGSRIPLLAALLPVNYLGPLVAASAVGVFLVVNSVCAGVRLSASAAKRVAVVSDAVFGVYLFHFVLIVLGDTLSPGWAALRMSQWWAAALTWLVIAALAFLVSLAARRVPGLRRLF